MDCGGDGEESTPVPSAQETADACDHPSLRLVPTCPWGHSLTTHVNMACSCCDGCKRSLTTGARIWTCKQCNWHLCTPCTEINCEANSLHGAGNSGAQGCCRQGHTWLMFRGKEATKCALCLVESKISAVTWFCRTCDRTICDQCHRTSSNRVSQESDPSAREIEVESESSGFVSPKIGPTNFSDIFACTIENLRWELRRDFASVVSRLDCVLARVDPCHNSSSNNNNNNSNSSFVEINGEQCSRYESDVLLRVMSAGRFKSKDRSRDVTSGRVKSIDDTVMDRIIQEEARRSSESRAGPRCFLSNLHRQQKDSGVSRSNASITDEPSAPQSPRSRYLAVDLHPKFQTLDSLPSQQSWHAPEIAFGRCVTAETDETVPGAVDSSKTAENQSHAPNDMLDAPSAKALAVIPASVPESSRAGVEVLSTCVRRNSTKNLPNTCPLFSADGAQVQSSRNSCRGRRVSRRVSDVESLRDVHEIHLINNQIPQPHDDTAEQYDQEQSSNEEVPESAVMPIRKTRTRTRDFGNMDVMRSKREQELLDRCCGSLQDDCMWQASNVSEIDELSTDTDAHVAAAAFVSHGILYVFGILPLRCNSRFDVYGAMVLLTSLVLFVCHIAWAASCSCFLFVRFADVLFAAGSFVGLAVLRLKHISALVGQDARPLDTHARVHGFYEAWMLQSFRNACCVFVIWLATFSAFILLKTSFDDIPFEAYSARDTSGGYSSPPISMFFFMSALNAALVYGLLHTCCFLELMVDSFCVRFFEDPDFVRGISEWNIIQAIMRRTANAIELCFLFLHTSVGGALLLTGAEIVSTPADGRREKSTFITMKFLSWLPTVLLMLFMLFRATAITEKCKRAPALVNSLIYGREDSINVQRQYMVEFIDHSLAGFYVQGMRLTSFMCLKYVYFLVIIVFSFLTLPIRDDA
eukprot:TRINITY_DN6352_c1_g2_i2.p1 TRINITY_DN6352_c1_g2~~TRINITY_DN6352_c1_g2_i2.p1  ORF type:complete len:923 (-),score=87.58 TRINITY_DN6352_c1_g2_i2:85-2853(-)